MTCACCPLPLDMSEDTTPTFYRRSSNRSGRFYIIGRDSKSQHNTMASVARPKKHSSGTKKGSDIEYDGSARRRIAVAVSRIEDLSSHTRSAS